jgi:hypothetical protein
MSLHAQPGVYALLVGSGVSRAVGVPTGWDVVKMLVDQAAAITPGHSASAVSGIDPDAWWAEHGDGEPLGYSNLLERLGPTSAVRRDIVSGFFEPTDEERSQGLKVPGPAHRAIAELVKRGTVRLILTTNFDRLLEDAIAEAGVQPEVVSSIAEIAGMTPLIHSRCTIIKLHGDYSSLDQRHTVDELATYPDELKNLLATALDEHGLIISGWSGEWDAALVEAIRASPSRRYPMYFGTRSALAAAAQTLVAARAGLVIESAPAESFFPEIVDQLQALDVLADPPLTTALAVTRLKRFLPDPLRRIDLEDLVLGEVDKAGFRIFDGRPESPPDNAFQSWEDELVRMRRELETVLQLLVAGVSYDRNDAHSNLWVKALSRLVRLRREPVGQFDPRWDALKHYPALLVLRAAGIAALRSHNDALFLQLQREPAWALRDRTGDPLSALDVLHDYSVLDFTIVQSLPMWNGTTFKFPMSRFLKAKLSSLFLKYGEDAKSYEQLSHRYEYFTALAQSIWGEDMGASFPAPGEFMGDFRWDSTTGHPTVESEFRREAGREAWGWRSVADGADDPFEKVLTNLAESLARSKGFG